MNFLPGDGSVGGEVFKVYIRPAVGGNARRMTPLELNVLLLSVFMQSCMFDPFVRLFSFRCAFYVALKVDPENDRRFKVCFLTSASQT